MKLQFLGNGSGFSDEHTSAFFSFLDKELVIIDCPISTFQKVKHTLHSYENIYVLITHTHGDHIGGLGLLAQYAFFTQKKLLNIVAPSAAVAKDISTVLTIEGNESSWYNLVTADSVSSKQWFNDCILTKHSPQLEGKCFGYHLTVDGKNVVYTGDTSTLEPFLPYITDGSYLYVDTSVFYGQIHLKLSEALEDFIAFTKRGITVYLMHLDDPVEAEKIVADYPNIKVVTTA